jgi:23S rRNA U2552 (ribose-2'-O)-methylase RlmE/FtsJ
MTYYLLPRSNLLSQKYIDCILTDEVPGPVISFSLSNYLYEIKGELESQEKDWDIFKKYTNPYEYIHTQIPQRKKCVSKYKPLSRSYFKMIEIIKLFDLYYDSSLPESFTDYSQPIAALSWQNHQLTSLLRREEKFDGTQCEDPITEPSSLDNKDTATQIPYFTTMRSRTPPSSLRPVRSFHLAEGPGGFIEAFSSVRKCPQDLYVGMTILDENNDPNIPAWKKTEHFLRQNKNVFIEKGATGTGNILAIENLDYCREKYGSSMDLITADGGFDFSLDFNQQEIIISRLLYAQMTFAILLQRQGGCFILKIFDAFMQHSVDILFILSSFYEKTYIIKPQTSRYANSEKYVVCKNFLFNSVDSHYPILHRTFEKMMASPEKYVHRFMTIPIPLHFVTRLEEYNAIFGQQQIENIHYTISLIKNKNRQDKIENLIKTNVQKCIAWCIKYNVPFFTFTNNVGQQLTTPNIFADREQGQSPIGAQP